MLNSVLPANGVFTAESLLFCTLVALALGVVIALAYMYKNVYTKSFVVTLTLLPALVQLVIMLVNGNLGTGVAVLGAFSLIRFRSVPGSAREILCIFFAMALGLACGMGYLVIAALFALALGAALVLLSVTKFGEPKDTEKDLKIVIPENLDYNGLFDDLFEKHTKGAELIRVKTTNMGSLYELQYRIRLNSGVVEKEFIDEMRCRNGNLNITCGRVSMMRDEL